MHISNSHIKNIASPHSLNIEMKRVFGFIIWSIPKKTKNIATKKREYQNFLKEGNVIEVTVFFSKGDYPDDK